MKQVPSVAREAYPVPYDSTLSVSRTRVTLYSPVVALMLEG